jgi:type VI secretion system protein ImpE
MQEHIMSDGMTGVLLRDGQLAAAVEAAGEAVRRAPAEAGPRLLLAELLVLAGELERADAVLEAAAGVAPEAALPVAEFRHLLRAAIARRQVLRDGRLPEFVDGPTAAQECCLQALLALRAEDPAAAAAAARAAEAARPPRAGEADGVAFADWRDIDDLWAGTVEVLTTDGRYLWLAAERVASLQFHKPVRPRDLAWRRCAVLSVNGSEGEVYMPALYDTVGALDDAMRLGRGTTWSAGEPVRGSGQRMFLLGDAGVPALQLGALSFA